MYCLENLLVFENPLLFCYTNLNSSIICCLFFVNICLSFGISLLTCSFSGCNSFEDFLEEFVISSAIFLPIKSGVAPAFFWIALFEVVSIAPSVDLSRSFAFICFSPGSSMVFVCFSKAFPRGQSVNLACSSSSSPFFWLDGTISSLVRYSYLSILPDD